MTSEDLLPPYTPEEKFRELCMRSRFLYGRIRQQRKKRQEEAEPHARLREKPLREGDVPSSLVPRQEGVREWAETGAPPSRSSVHPDGEGPAWLLADRDDGERIDPID